MACLLMGLVLLAAQAVGAAEERQWVKVGEWQLRTTSFVSCHGAVPTLWRGTADRDIAREAGPPPWEGGARGPLGGGWVVLIGGGALPGRGGQRTQELGIEGLGTITVTTPPFDLDALRGPEAYIRMIGRDERVEVRRRVAVIRKRQTIAVDGPYTMTVAEWASEEPPVIESAMQPALDLLRAMLSQRRVLGSYDCGTDFPQVTATVDGAAPIELEGRSGIRGSDWSWALPARPGQEVELTVRMRAANFTVTTQGIERTDEADALHHAQVSAMKGGQSLTGELDAQGATRVHIGKMEDSRQISLRIPWCYGTDGGFAGYLRLRWGRPEEQWLDTGLYPMAGAPNDRSADSSLVTLASDLDAAFDPDTGYWFERWGSTRLYRPERADLGSVAGPNAPGLRHPLDTGKTEDAGDWTYRFDLRGGDLNTTSWPRVTIPQLRECVRDSIRKWGGPELWDPLAGQDGRRGWHHARKVCGLALLWRRFPELRADIPLERTLDFWCESLKTQPFPLDRPAMAGYLEDRSAYSLACAVVALHIGHQTFPKPEYRSGQGRPAGPYARGQTGAAVESQQGCGRPSAAPALRHDGRPDRPR